LTFEPRSDVPTLQLSNAPTPLDPISKTRILIADDHSLYRDGLRRFIESQPNLGCCGETDSYESTLDKVRCSPPDLLILDLRLRRADAMELVRIFHVEQPQLRILVLSQGDEAVYAEQALRAGAHGYVMKEEATEELLNAINTVLGGELYTSRRIAALVLKRFILGDMGDGPNARLTERETQVFQMLGSGLSTHEVADQLHLSVKTIETHRENIKHKLDLPNAAGLIQAARQWVANSQR
jgi:DNA-binding NarL/FixJ family response regulator